ncbi:Purine nucleoside phosphorylase [Coemansia sp. RSA 1200]|nr:Purine nucleoside phosphorylase [Coemansia sp. RSA 1200]
MTHIPHETYAQSADYIRKQLNGNVPEVGIVCGSGLGGLADTLEGDTIAIPYEEIPGFVRSTTEGHKGQLIFGTLAGKRVVCMMGRFHCYEGHSVYQATFPIRVMHLVGVKTLIATNAAGGINPAYEVGDVVLIADHLSLPGIAGSSALVGPNIVEFGVRFPSISDAYTPRLRRIAAKEYLTNTHLRQDRQLRLHEGIYAWCYGPCYESRAELRALRTLGADVVGMSTVPETVVAKHCGMDVLALTLVTNKCVSRRETDTIETMAAELAGTPIQEPVENFPNHEEVLVAVSARTADLQMLVSSIVRNI